MSKAKELAEKTIKDIEERRLKKEKDLHVYEQYKKIRMDYKRKRGQR